MDVSYRYSLVPLYKAGAKIGLKDFQVKAYDTLRNEVQVFLSEVSSVF